MTWPAARSGTLKERLKYIVAFGVFAAYFVVAGVVLGGWFWLLLWPAVSFALVSAAYLGLGPCVFGKGTDGRMARWATVPLLPFLLLTWTVWHLGRLLLKEPCCHEVAPGLWLGRRALVRELPPGVGLVVDLTAELPAPSGVRDGRVYVCLPTLDASAPAEDDLRDLVRRLAEWQGVVYLHCAQGHGRSALVAASVLIARGLAADPVSAENMLRRVRPGVRLKPVQRRLLARIVASNGPPLHGSERPVT